MSHSRMNSAKNVNVLAPADKIFFFSVALGEKCFESLGATARKRQKVPQPRARHYKKTKWEVDMLE